MSNTKLFLTIFLAIVLGGCCVMGGLAVVLDQTTPTPAPMVALPPAWTDVPPTAVPPTAVPPTAIPPTAPPRTLTQTEWANKMLLSLMTITNELDTLGIYGTAMESNPYDATYGPLFARSFRVIDDACEEMIGLNEPASVSASVAELERACNAFHLSGAEIARYFETYDIEPLEAALDWLTQANTHIERAGDLIP